VFQCAAWQQCTNSHRFPPPSLSLSLSARQILQIRRLSCFQHRTLLCVHCSQNLFHVFNMLTGHDILHCFVSLTKDCAAVNATDRLSAVCPLMGVKPNPGTADARTALAWPDAEVAGGLSPKLADLRTCTEIRASLFWSWRHAMELWSMPPLILDP